MKKKQYNLITKKKEINNYNNRNIFGILLNEEKHMNLNFLKIYGIGYVKAKLLCYKYGLGLRCKLKQISSSKFQKIVEDFIKRKQSIYFHFGLLKAIKKNIKDAKRSRKYWRFTHNLPTRGQRTHSNAQTIKKLKKFYSKKLDL